MADKAGEVLNSCLSNYFGIKFFSPEKATGTNLQLQIKIGYRVISS
jgi:hypothetical protein